MFKGLTPEAGQVMLRARDGAARLGHDWIGCEHLLLGLADPQTHVGALITASGAPTQVLEEAIVAVIGRGPVETDDRLLATLGIDAEEVRRAVDATFGAGALTTTPATGRRGRRRLGRRRASCGASPGKPRLTPKAKRCLEMAWGEARRRGHDEIGSVHIALALLSRGDTLAWRVLLHVGVVPEQVRRAVEEPTRNTT